MSTFARLIVILCLAAAAAGAQAYQPGDLLVGTWSFQSGGKLLAITPYQNQYTTVAAIPFSLAEDVQVGPANVDTFVAGTVLVRVTPGGVVTSVLPWRVSGGMATPDEDGRLLYATGGGLLSIDLKRASYATIRTGVVSHVVLDRDTGEYVIADSSRSPGRLLRVKRDGTVTTIIPFTTVHGMGYHPPTGDTFVVWARTVYRLHRSNQLTTFLKDAGEGVTLAVLENGHIAVGPKGNHITAFDVTGRRIGKLYSGAGLFKSGLAVAGIHHVWALNAARRGSVLDLSIRFGRHPSKPYVAAAALARAPGISIAGGRVIPLAPDGLLLASLYLPQVFRGFKGVLDSSGAARASVALPAHPALKDVRVFYAAVVIDPASPGGIAAVSQTFGATIQ